MTPRPTCRTPRRRGGGDADLRFGQCKEGRPARAAGRAGSAARTQRGLQGFYSCCIVLLLHSVSVICVFASLGAQRRPEFGEALVSARLRRRSGPLGAARLRQEVGHGRGAQLVGRSGLEVGEAGPLAAARACVLHRGAHRRREGGPVGDVACFDRPVWAEARWLDRAWRRRRRRALWRGGRCSSRRRRWRGQRRRRRWGGGQRARMWRWARERRRPAHARQAERQGVVERGGIRRGEWSVFAAGDLVVPRVVTR